MPRRSTSRRAATRFICRAAGPGQSLDCADCRDGVENPHRSADRRERVPTDADEQQGDGNGKQAKEPADKKPDDETDSRRRTKPCYWPSSAQLPMVRIDWTATAEGASGLAALANVEAQQTVRMRTGRPAPARHAGLTISRAELARLTVEVPADQKVVNVASPNVRGWSVEAAGETQQITVDYSSRPAMRKPSRSTWSSIPAEQTGRCRQRRQERQSPRGRQGRRSPAAPASPCRSFALDVSRQQGVVVVDVAEGLQVETRTPRA